MRPRLQTTFPFPTLPAMDFDFQWLLLALPVAFALGWLGSRFDLRQLRTEERSSPRAYFKGLNLLLNEQQDKAIDAFIEAVQQDPDTSDLHFALGNLFRRRGEYERAVRVHEHLLGRSDLPHSERERAQYALAQDFMKAGLFDRAEAAFRTLEDTIFRTEAWLALLTLYERSRDWREAMGVARKLEAAGAGSFASRISHYWCEIALEADARGDAPGADDALKKAREAAPQSPRALVLTGQRLERLGQHAEAMSVWTELMTVHPASFALVAGSYANSAVAAGQVAVARDRLRAQYDRAPSRDVLEALLRLEEDPTGRHALLFEHLDRRPGISAVAGLLEEDARQSRSPTPTETRQLHQVAALAAKPLQRYRCAACGFEAQHYFWQCPGCQSWDSYPPLRLEEL